VIYMHSVILQSIYLEAMYGLFIALVWANDGSKGASAFAVARSLHSRDSPLKLEPRPEIRP